MMDNIDDEVDTMMKIEDKDVMRKSLIDVIVRIIRLSIRTNTRNSRDRIGSLSTKKNTRRE